MCTCEDFFQKAVGYRYALKVMEQSLSRTHQYVFSSMLVICYLSIHFTEVGFMHEAGCVYSIWIT